MRKADELFAEKEKWILDGGLATELAARGVDLNHHLWSAKALKENPEAIFDTHLSYLEAGADIITTASYQASIEGFTRYGMYNREARETIFSSVMLATYAREKYFETHERRPVLIAGSVGPYGAYLADGSEYTGAYATKPELEKDLAKYYFDKIEVLLSPRKNYRVDFLLFETLPLFSEAEFILSHMRKYPGAPVVFSFSRKEEALKAAKAFAKDQQVAAIGFNCMSTPDMTKALQELAASSSKPIIAYPNSGAVYDAHTKTWSKKDLQETEWSNFVKLADKLRVKIKGGCCGTAPRDIAQIQELTA